MAFGPMGQQRSLTGLEMLARDVLPVIQGLD